MKRNDESEVPNHRELLKSRVAVTPKEYAQIYRCSEGLVYKAIRDGEIKSIRVGNKIAIPTGPILAELGIE